MFWATEGSTARCMGRSDLVPCALTTNIINTVTGRVQTSPYDTCIARSDCDFRVKDLGTTAAELSYQVGIYKLRHELFKQLRQWGKNPVFFFFFYMIDLSDIPLENDILLVADT